MLIRVSFLVALLAITTFCSAQTLPSTQPYRLFQGKLDNGGDRGKTVGAFGNRGCWVIRSQARMQQIAGRFASVGFPLPEADALAAIDFEKQMIVGIFDCGDEGNAFTLRDFSQKDGQADVDIAMSYIIYKQRGQVVDKCKYLFVAIPRATSVRMSVSTYHPHNGGANPTIDKAKLEWRRTFDASCGDVVDALTATIEPKAATLKCGEDILLQFKLSLADCATEEWGRFASKTGTVSVWDGKYSEGYRNHGFLVQTPDGKTQFLQPKLIMEWDKNIPHLEEIIAGKPYILPNWVEREQYKSLKDIGLKTDQPGKYVITGVYSEIGGNRGFGRADGPLSWGGDIATNTVVVEARK